MQLLKAMSEDDRSPAPKMNWNQAAHKETQNEVDLQNQGVNETKNTTWTVNWKLS